jgi:hypothetical protein
MVLPGREFTGFDAKDFDAFEEHKWSSNRFNLERMRVREKLLALQRAYATAFEAAGVAIESSVGLDHPTILNNKRVASLALVFSRTEAQRKELARFIEREIPLAERVSDPDPEHQHLRLGVRVHQGGVDVAFSLHRHAILDVRNLAEKVGDTWEGENLRLILDAIPEGFDLRGPAGDVHPVSELLKCRGAEMKCRLEGALQSLAIVRTFKRDDPAVADSSFAEALQDALNRLLPVYRYTAWDRENDWLSIKKLLKEDRQHQKLVKAGKAADVALHLKKGDRVQVTAGLFSGKQGSVTDIDARGRLKVFLGKLSVTLTEKEVKKA